MKKRDHIMKNIKGYLHFYYNQQVVFFESGDLYFLTAKVLVEWDKRFKLVLRQLIDMTDEERNELEETKVFQRATPVHVIGSMVLTAESFRWLVSHHFDIFKLIEDGLALDEREHHQSEMS